MSIAAVAIVVLLAGTTNASGLARFAKRSFARAATQGIEFSFTAAGDYGATRNTGATLDAIAAAQPTFHLALGDLSYDHVVPETAWCSFVRRHIGGDLAFVLLSGNHEDFNTAPFDGTGGNINAFADCLEDRLGNISGTYSRESFFDYPPQQPLARFVMLTPELTFEDGVTRYVRGSPHYQWTADVIEGARDQGIPWVIVAAHKPCLTMGFQHCSGDADLMNLLLEKRVDLVLHGHEHNYQRTKQLALNGANCEVLVPDNFNPGCIADGAVDVVHKDRGTVFVTVGTGGQGITELNGSDAEVPYFASFMGSNTAHPTFGFLWVQVTDWQLRVLFQATTDRAFSDALTIEASY